MTVLGKIVTSVLVAAIASGITTYVQGNPQPDFLLFTAFVLATLATAFLTSISRPVDLSTASEPSPPKPAPKKKPKSKPATGGNREEGQVKWFNASKGFGFITKDDGEEIFVHFRSILGEGRRGLRDGQRVSFRVADSDKGPQAEEVEGLD